MNEYIKNARLFLEQEQIDYLLVNSTNKFLVEYNSLNKNSRYLLTGFSGSTGDAVVSKDNVFLFVDGRYHIQADLEVNHDDISVVKMEIGCFLDELYARVCENSTIGICSYKNSQYRYKTLAEKFKDKNVKIKLFDTDPVENISKDELQAITEVPVELSGQTTDEKIKQVSNTLKEDEAVIINNLEDLSYLYNIRNFNKENSCSVEGKAIITKNQNILFKDNTLCDFEKFINNSKNISTYFVNEVDITAKDYRLIANKAKKSEIKIKKYIKTDAEIEHYKDAFERTDKAILATREFILNNDNISEFDIKTELENNFKRFGAKCQSFTSIVAKDKNSALAHYSKSSKEEIVKNGSLILIDCGGYYDGGLATDTTRVFVKGEPTELHKKVYTSVLKAFLHAFNIKDYTCGFDIDYLARHFLKNNSPEGFIFNHGLGHGIGVSVHEGPPRLSTACPDAFVEFEENMCFTIEPGLYRKDFFGVRLENSCYYKNGKINSFTKMCYEKKLIDFSMLDKNEQEWLSQFEVK